MSAARDVPPKPSLSMGELRRIYAHDPSEAVRRVDAISADAVARLRRRRRIQAADAEDLIANIIAAMLAGDHAWMETGRDDVALEVRIAGVATNRFRHLLRKLRAGHGDPTPPDEIAAPEPAPEVPEDAPRVRSPSVREALKLLTPQQRRAVRGRLDHMTLGQIAADLGLADPHGAGGLLRRAKARVRRLKATRARLPRAVVRAMPRTRHDAYRLWRQGRSAREIAGRLGWTEKSVKDELFRIRKLRRG